MPFDGPVYVAGGMTLIGSALRRRLSALGASLVDDPEPSFADRQEVSRFLTRTRPAFILVAAGRSAGIAGNQRSPADLMRDNLEVATHLIPAAHEHGVRKLLYIASSCIYPKHASQPMAPATLWTGALEPTSAAYAVAKLAGITLCQAYRQQFGAPFITAIAADAYGPDDSFTDDSHVVPGLLRRFHDAHSAGAASVAIWGSGRPRREFIYADDLADACLFVMDRYDGSAPLNLGTGVQTSIAELASEVRDVVGYTGALEFDTSRPDGIPLKGLDSSALHALGWRPSVSLRQGLELTYRRFRESLSR